MFSPYSYGPLDIKQNLYNYLVSTFHKSNNFIIFIRSFCYSIILLVNLILDL